MFRNRGFFFAPDDGGSGGGDPQNDPEEGNTSSGSTDDTTSKPSGSTSNNNDTTDWKAKYQGMQKEYDKYKNKAEAELNAVKAKLAEKEAEINALMGTKVDLEAKNANFVKESESLKTVLGQKTTEAETAGKQLARMKMIANEFPQLAKFEANGLLPVAETDDELREKLKTFDSSVRTLAGQKANDLLSGSSPIDAGADNSGNNQADEDSLWSRIVQLQNGGLRTPKDLQEYNALMKQYDDLMDKKSKKA